MNSTLIRQIIRENRLMIAAVLLLTVLCGALWYATLQQAALVAEQQRSWHAKRRQAALHNKTQGIDQYQRDQEQLRKLFNTIPYRHEFPRVISEILDAMALRDVTPGPMQYKPRKTELNGIIAYTMTCSATGSYPGLKRLIVDLERLDGISTLDTISFSNTAGAADTVALTLELTVYLREGRP